MTREEVCVAGYDVVRNTGVAKTKLFDALESACCGNYEKAQALINTASELICKAQSLQTMFEERIEQEHEEKMSFVVEHGNDHLMTTIIFRDLVAEVTEPGMVRPQDLKAMFKAYH